MQRATGRSFLLHILLVSAPAAVVGTRQTMAARINPIRKVVNLLQAMQTKVTAEGVKEKELYEKFMCYCNGGKKELEASIKAAEEKVAALGPDIKAMEEKITQLKSDVAKAQAERADAKETVAKAKAIREKEAAAFAAENSDYMTNIAAIEKAVVSLEKGSAGSFLQTKSAAVVRKLAVSVEMSGMDREDLTAFLSGGQTDGYAPQSGQIIGILKQIGDEMKASLADAVAKEEAAIKAFEELMAAKTKEIKALTKSIETKLAQIGESSVSLAQMKEDLTDTQEAFAEDTKFLASLEKSCKTKTAEWEERSKTRADELVALADTIKILNDDDALELFKKTLPGAGSSFMQLRVGASALRSRALTLIRDARKTAGSRRMPGLDFLVMALSGKDATKGTFDKVIKMIDELVALLKEEQKSDDDKKEYCATQLDLADDKKKSLERTVSDEEGAIAAAEEGIATLTEEIKALEAGIKALDKSVTEATEQRKSEHLDYKDLMSSNSAAKELLGIAMNRLNKFYNPKLYKPKAKRELSAGDSIYENMGGEVATTTPGGIAGTGVTVFAQVRSHAQRSSVAPAPPPETWGAYQKKSEDTNGVMAMVNLLVKDLNKEMTEAETAEKDAQADYEVLMADSADKRKADSTSLNEKNSAKAELEGSLEDHKEAKNDAAKELMGTMKYIQQLHTECDWLVKYYDVRKEARDGEIDSLGKAKAVLSGADYSML